MLASYESRQGRDTRPARIHKEKEKERELKLTPRIARLAAVKVFCSSVGIWDLWREGLALLFFAAFSS